MSYVTTFQYYLLDMENAWNGTQIIFFLCIVLDLGICGRQIDKVIKIDEVYKLRNLNLELSMQDLVRLSWHKRQKRLLFVNSHCGMLMLSFVMRWRCIDQSVLHTVAPLWSVLFIYCCMCNTGVSFTVGH